MLVAGSPGGARIITTVLEVILNVIDHGMTVQEAVDAPRIHHQWLPDTLAAEPFALSADTAKALTRMGYRIVPLEPWGTGNAAEIIGVAPADAARPGHWVSPARQCSTVRATRGRRRIRGTSVMRMPPPQGMLTARPPRDKTSTRASVLRN